MLDESDSESVGSCRTLTPPPESEEEEVELTQQPQSISPSKQENAVVLKLVVLGGGASPTQRVFVLPWTQPMSAALTIGRSAKCNRRLKSPFTSNVQAVAMGRASGIYLTNVGSAPVSINGVLLPRYPHQPPFSEPVPNSFLRGPLKKGDVVVFGPATNPGLDAFGMAVPVEAYEVDTIGVPGRGERSSDRNRKRKAGDAENDEGGGGRGGGDGGRSGERRGKAPRGRAGGEAAAGSQPGEGCGEAVSGGSGCDVGGGWVEPAVRAAERDGSEAQGRQGSQKVLEK